MVHHFNVLQEEVRQERWELGKGRGKVRQLEGLHGTSTSAPVSTPTSPSLRLQISPSLPSSESSLLAKWQGRYLVKRQAGKVTNEISTPHKKKQSQIFHINMLRQWHERERPVEQHFFARPVGEEEEVEEQYLPVKEEDTTEINLDHLSEAQQ